MGEELIYQGESERIVKKEDYFYFEEFNKRLQAWEEVDKLHISGFYNMWKNELFLLNNVGR